MKRLITKSALWLGVALMAGGGGIARAATTEEAVALVKEAVQLVRQDREKAFTEFNNPAGRFVKGELYIVAVSLDGVVLAHGANAKMINKNILEIKDTDGKQFVKEQTNLAKTKGSGWVDFRWPNPVTKAIEPKTVYIEKVDDLLIAGGIYKK
ncbi:cache domain-containing protein [Pseudoduganella namucuonensis]|uniref:Single Cache domain 2-containing protein n=1 Tax=Pseudoduganella namucuonensis TaxID=1035707 RepID=A0A1I7LMX3_9BURK|nr:cache domain-containing protein [Pseudoduganella namucuonensis]SFV11008.1 Single Cache domain 2-containing protein [Pseudoduganella namucuonensis]